MRRVWISLSILAVVTAVAAVAGLNAASGAGATHRLVAFLRSGAVWVVNDDGSGLRRMTGRQTRVASFGWAPDGRRLVVATVSAGLAIVTLTNRTPHLITTSSDHWPAWSPDGRRIAFGRGDYGEIWTVAPSGRGARRLVKAYDAAGAAWSPDSKRLAFGWDAGDSYNAFAVIGADGKGRINIGTNGDNAFGPVWSTDGQQIAFNRNRMTGPGLVLWLMNADGSNQHLLTPDANPDDVNQQAPAWSPDGHELAFAAWIGQYDGPGENEVDVINVDGTQRRTVAINAYAPQWSRDGSEIAFTRPRGKMSDLLVMNADGSNQDPIAQGSIDEFSWQP